MKSRDLREYSRQTNVRLAAGALLVLFIIGDGLIFLIYGPGAAGMGLICLASAIAPIILIVLVLWLMEWIVKRAHHE